MKRLCPWQKDASSYREMLLDAAHPSHSTPQQQGWHSEDGISRKMEFCKKKHKDINEQKFYRFRSCS